MSQSQNAELMMVSGTETLLPYLKEKKTEEKEPTIIVDSREANTHTRITIYHYYLVTFSMPPYVAVSHTQL